MAELVNSEELIARYPDSAPEAGNPGMPYATFGSEIAELIALGEKPEIAARCKACGLRDEAWTELRGLQSIDRPKGGR